MIRNRSNDPLPVPAKLLGPCAEIAGRTGINPTLVRIAAVLMLICWFKLTLVTYCVAAIAFRAERR